MKFRWRRRRQPQSRAHEKPYTLDMIFGELEKMWQKRGPVTTFATFDGAGNPVAAFDSHGHYAAVWPFTNGAPE